MGHLDVTCRECQHEEFGVNSRTCVKCGSINTHTTSDEDFHDDEEIDETWDDDEDLDSIEMEAD